MTLFGVVWGLAVLGVVFKAVLIGRLRVLSVAFYVVLGWLVIIAARPLAQAVAPGGLVLQFGGGVAYTGGVAFYAAQKLRYHHVIWHAFVLLGSILHFFAVLFYVVPLAQWRQLMQVKDNRLESFDPPARGAAGNPARAARREAASAVRLLAVTHAEGV